jgi:hypothetical protein
MNMFERWKQEIDVEGLKKDIEEAANGGGKRDYKEVPHGVYEVSIEKMEMVESKASHKPMMTVWFKVMAGEYKGNKIFYNQVLTTGTGIHFANEFLRSLELETVSDIEENGGKLFTGWEQYSNLLMDCTEEMDENHLTFELEYTKGKKGFSNYLIAGVFEN